MRDTSFKTSPPSPLLRGEGSCAPFPRREGGQEVRSHLLLNRSLFARVLVCVLLLCMVLPLPAQVEAFRVRIVLLPAGTIGISVDGGAHFTTIGRVTTLPQRLGDSRLPARTAVIQDKGLWVIQHNETQSVGLAADGVQSSTALRTDIPVGSVLFRDFGTKISARLMLQEGQVAYSMPPSYRYKLGDVWVLQVLAEDDASALPIREAVTTALPKESLEAVQRSIQRGEKANLPVVNGTLNLEVTARYAETVKFVFFTVDGYLVGTSNVLPTIFRWDSTQVADGEYVLEVRAMDKDEREVALVRKRILVRNGAH
ncbi:MAG: hypothetical protein KatS3mg023_1235 [Armatimonadota bacterium]|nr:MAG: hypothetical protein KatS3mg023_1235 [Armatimonadota bacterium]